MSGVFVKEKFKYKTQLISSAKEIDKTCLQIGKRWFSIKFGNLLFEQFDFKFKAR